MPRPRKLQSAVYRHHIHSRATPHGPRYTTHHQPHPKVQITPPQGPHPTTCHIRRHTTRTHHTPRTPHATSHNNHPPLHKLYSTALHQASPTQQHATRYTVHGARHTVHATRSTVHTVRGTHGTREGMGNTCSKLCTTPAHQAPAHPSSRQQRHAKHYTLHAPPSKLPTNQQHATCNTLNDAQHPTRSAEEVATDIRYPILWHKTPLHASTTTPRTPRTPRTSQ
jgi:hypothetical protein